jgi:hypothetical protein
MYTKGPTSSFLPKTAQVDRKSRMKIPHLSPVLPCVLLLVLSDSFLFFLLFVFSVLLSEQDMASAASVPQTPGNRDDAFVQLTAFLVSIGLSGKNASMRLRLSATGATGPTSPTAVFVVGEVHFQGDVPGQPRQLFNTTREWFNVVKVANWKAKTRPGKNVPSTQVNGLVHDLVLPGSLCTYSLYVWSQLIS